LRLFKIIPILLILASCERPSWLSFLQSNDTKEGKEVRELIETLPPEKGVVVERSLASGDLSKAVNTIVEAPNSDPDCDPIVEDTAVKNDNSLCPNQELAGKPVLYLGDSHSYIPSETSSGNGVRLGHKMIESIGSCPGTELHYHAACGSRPRSWIGSGKVSSPCGVTKRGPDGFKAENKGSTENLIKLSEDINPGHIIINLGDNMFNWRNENGLSVAYIGSESRLVNEMRDFIFEIPNESDCTWIGPAYHVPGSTYSKSNSAVDDMVRLIKEGINARCKFIDSRQMSGTTSPNDGLHMTRADSRRWADFVLSNL